MARAGFYDEADAELERIPIELRFKERAIDAADFIKSERRSDEILREKLDEVMSELQQMVRTNVKVAKDLRDDKQSNIDFSGTFTDSIGGEWVLEDKSGKISGTLKTDTKKYKVEGERAFCLCTLSCKETHYLQSVGLRGLLGFLNTQPNNQGASKADETSPRWVTTSGRKEEFSVWLLLDGGQKKALKITDNNSFQKFDLTIDACER